MFSNKSARVSGENFSRVANEGVEEDGREGKDNKSSLQTCGIGGSKSGKARAGNVSTSILRLQGKLVPIRLERLR